MRVHGGVQVVVMRAESNARLAAVIRNIVVYAIIREWGNINNQLLCLLIIFQLLPRPSSVAPLVLLKKKPN